MKEFLTDFLGPFMGMMAALFVILLGAFSLLNATLGPNRCANYEQTTSRATQWDFWGGCYVESKGTWYTMAEYQSSIAASDALTISDGE